MDALKNLLQKRKPEQKSWVKKSEQEEKQRQEYLKKQQEREEKQNIKKFEQLKQRSELYKGDLENIDKLFEQGIKQLKKQNEELEQQQQDEQEEQDPDTEVPMEKDEVIKKLREISQPITLFGETDWKRYRRLLKIQENLEEAESNQMQANFFSGQAQKKGYVSKMDKVEVDQDFLDKIIQKRLDMDAKDKKKNDDYVETKISGEEKGQGIINWANKMMKEWEQKLQNLYPDEAARKTQDGRKAMGLFRQCHEYIGPLFTLIKQKRLNDDILTPVYQIAYYSLKKEYVRAHDKYLDVAIGNAPWPMGVTMVGIHERAGRSKINSSQIAHVLNDENQRKFLSSVKRLVTVSQKLYPTEPAKMVNFAGEAGEIF